MSANPSSTGSAQSSLPSRELPDELVAFIAKKESLSEPPRKRQKTTSGARDSTAFKQLDHIVVKTTTWEIIFATSKLSRSKTPMEINNFRPYVHWDGDSDCPEYLEIVDGRHPIFHVPLPPKKDSEDFHLALLVDHQSSKWAKEEGKLWYVECSFLFRTLSENRVLDMYLES